MSKQVIEFVDVNKYFGGLPVLNDISFRVSRGEVTCLLGPSGSGKTTVFNLAAGLLEPDSGRVEVRADYRKGFVFQEPRLLPWKTLEENIKFVQGNYLSPERAEKVRERLFRLTRLTGARAKYPGELSGGMKQRLELIRAFSINPDLVLMDEPLRSLDTRTAYHLREMLLKFRREGELTYLLITHDPEAAAMMADKILVLSEGPAEIVKKYRVKTPRKERDLRRGEINRLIEDMINLFVELVELSGGIA
ncbi:MAG: ABC transporter ATP-binding protein [Bacillota bacterium]